MLTVGVPGSLVGISSPATVGGSARDARPFRWLGSNASHRDLSPDRWFEPDVAAMNARPPSDRPYLTEHGRRLLEDRIRVLETTVGELQSALDDPELRADSIEEYQRAARELTTLRSNLDTAGAVEDIPDDPRVVELGDIVAIRLDDGTEETYIIVHAVEAPVEDQRISIESPLGRALLGKHVGDTVEVPVPTGSYRCTILRADRREPPDQAE